MGIYWLASIKSKLKVTYLFFHIYLIKDTLILRMPCLIHADAQINVIMKNSVCKSCFFSMFYVILNGKDGICIYVSFLQRKAI